MQLKRVFINKQSLKPHTNHFDSDSNPIHYTITHILNTLDNSTLSTIYHEILYQAQLQSAQ